MYSPAAVEQRDRAGAGHEGGDGRKLLEPRVEKEPTKMRPKPISQRALRLASVQKPASKCAG